MRYTVIIHEAEEGGFWTEVPALPGAGSQGETFDEALASTQEAIELWIEAAKTQGRPVPADDQVVRTIEVAA
ncbi:MAG: type II toxin-antitoxin system HicB family antitoxin [Chloroflexi bacterium]|nr:type II toxin-antitoxin system HicB family antitoxin [Chloroflexota bacterium]